MKVSVRNLGVIKEAEIDLKPFTVFIGPNNAGKTWLAYTIAGILGKHGSTQYLIAYLGGKVQEVYHDLENAIEQVLSEGNAKIDLVQFADEYGEAYFNNVARLAPRWMQGFMGSGMASFDLLEAQFQFLESKPAFLNKLLWRSFNNRLSVGQRQRDPLLSALKETGKRELYIYTTTEGDITEKLPRRAIKEFLVRLVFQGLFTTLYDDLYTFPTERTTYIAFPMNPPELSEGKRLIRDTSQQEQSVRFGQWYLYNFLSDLMAGLYRCRLSVREKEAQGNPNISAYMHLAHLLETYILNGNLDFSTPEPDPKREIVFKTSNDLTLDMPVVSSMVKELAPLVLYLRYLAQPGEWLIIDEPEMNLHPEAQAKLTEFLAMLVKAGLPVLITTHSPYIVDHLTNLMKAAESTEPEAIQDKFYLQNKDAFISKNDVSVYLVDQGKTENMLDEDGVVHWSTFGTVSDRVSEIFFEL